MVVPPVATSQRHISASLTTSARQLLCAAAIGVLVWTLLMPLCTAEITWPTDRFSRLLLVVSLQAGFFFVSMSRRTRIRSCSFLAALSAGCLCMFAAAMLGLSYDVLLRQLFGTGSPTLGPWGEVRDLGHFPAAVFLMIGVLLGPAADERFFRAGLFGSWADANRPWSGALLSAASFALARLDLWNLPAYFGLGLLLCAVYRWTGSLLSAWTAHALLNTLMFTLLYCGYA